MSETPGYIIMKNNSEQASTLTLEREKRSAQGGHSGYVEERPFRSKTSLQNYNSSCLNSKLSQLSNMNNLNTINNVNKIRKMKKDNLQIRRDCSKRRAASNPRTISIHHRKLNSANLNVNHLNHNTNNAYANCTGRINNSALGSNMNPNDSTISSSSSCYKEINDGFRNKYANNPNLNLSNYINDESQRLSRIDSYLNAPLNPDNYKNHEISRCEYEPNSSIENNLSSKNANVIGKFSKTQKKFHKRSGTAQAFDYTVVPEGHNLNQNQNIKVRL
jgi:hypothetical protein